MLFESEFRGKAYAHLEDLLADDQVEAVYIASPHGLHRDHAVASAEAGKHILVDKPLAISLSDAKEIVDVFASMDSPTDSAMSFKLDAVLNGKDDLKLIKKDNRKLASEFSLENNEVTTIKCLKKTEAKTYPPSQFPEEEKKLKGFIWREDEQPKVMEDIFIKGKSLIKNNPLKGLKPQKRMSKKTDLPTIPKKQ